MVLVFVMVLACVKVLARVMVLAHVMVLARGMVLACVMAQRTKLEVGARRAPRLLYIIFHMLYA